VQLIFSIRLIDFCVFTRFDGIDRFGAQVIAVGAGMIGFSVWKKIEALKA